MRLAGVARSLVTLACRDLWSGGRPRRGLVPIVISLLMGSVFTMTFLMVFGSLASAGASLEVHARVLAWAFTLGFLLLALGDLHTVVSAAATAPDLERLLAAPLRPREMLLLKFMETLSRTLGPVVVIALPAALSFMWVTLDLRIGALFVALLALWSVPLGFGSALAMPLLRLAPARRLRETTAVLATFAFLAGWLANTFWMPRLVANADLTVGLRAIPAPPAWLPATWAADALVFGGRRGLDGLVACAVASVLALLLAAFVSERMLTQLQSDAVSAPGTSVRGTARRASTLAGAFLRRDLDLFARDWPVLLDLFARLALWTLLPLAVLPLAPLPPAELLRDMLVTLTLSLGNDIGTRALPLERHSLAWARLAPVGGARWVSLRALGVGSLGFVILAAGSVLAGSALRLPFAVTANAFLFALPAAAVALATGFLLGATLADPEWRDPRTMLGPGGRTVSAFVMLSQGGLWVLASHAIGAASVPATWLVPLLVMGAVATWALLGVAARAVERREYTAR